MKDQILFRGKTESGKWIYGDIVQQKRGEWRGIASQLAIAINAHTVIPETATQYVNLTDKNGNPAFVGNIYKEVRLDGSERLYRIFEVTGGFAINQFQDDFYKKDEDILFYAGLSDAQTASFFRNSLIEIGNIFDNPELLISKSC